MQPALPELRPPPKPPDPLPAAATSLPFDLGKHIAHASHLFATKGWEATVRALRAAPDIHPEVKSLPHPAGRLLDHLRKHGAPVKFHHPPGPDQPCQAMNRGPHQSAKDHGDFLWSEMGDMAEKGQWMVLPFDQVKDLPGLHISPLGVVPQHERRPRTIVDYSYYGLNDNTVNLAPREAMQFGRTLERLMDKIVHADKRHGPVHLIKVDIADGFYRIYLNIHDIPRLAVTFLGPNGEHLVAFPLTLPMGWEESPPHFSVSTETACDLANASPLPPVSSPPHPLEIEADSMPESISIPARGPTDALDVPIHPLGPRKPPLDYTDVYVDDFLGLGQGSPARLKRIRRKLFECIDKIFRPLKPGDPAARQHPISLKKLRKGDARWETRKVTLGWILDTVQESLELTPRRLSRLQEILDDIPPSKRRISAKKWHKVLGELRSMTLALPGLRGLFSLLQEALRHEDRHRIPLNQGVHDFLADIQWLLDSVASRPTRLRELVPTALACIGATDASGSGMGGVAFLPHPDGTVVPILWRAPFSQDIQAQLVSWNNPTGSITNSDLELAATIAHQDVVASFADTRERTTGTVTDNTPAESWQQKGSTTTVGPAAHLLRLQAMHQRACRYLNVTGYIPGKVNIMADDTSRLWQHSNEALLTHFNTHYPQERTWTLCPLRPDMISWLTSALHRKRPGPPSPPPAVAPRMQLGEFGRVSASPWESIPTYGTSKIPLPSYKSLPSGSVMDASPKAVDVYGLAQYVPAFKTWARRLPWWGPRTLA